MFSSARANFDLFGRTRGCIGRGQSTSAPARDHAFVVTAHMCKDKIENEFDRIFKFDDEKSAGYTSFCKFDENSENSIIFRNPSTDIDGNGRGSIRRGLPAMFVLWHGQYAGWPKVEIVMLLASFVSAVVLGLSIYSR